MKKNEDRIILSLVEPNKKDLEYIQQYFKKNKGQIQFNKYWYREK